MSGGIKLIGWSCALALAILGGAAVQVPTLESVSGLLRRNQSAAAEQEARALLARVEREKGPDALQIADILDLLSEAMRERSPVSAGDIDLVARAVQIREKAQGAVHPDVARSLTNVAILRAMANDPAAARPLIERALEIREAAFGPNDLLVASSLNNLAGVLIALKDDAGARKHLQRAVDIKEHVHGSESVEFASALYNFANFLRETNDFSAARTAYERALKIQESAFGRNSPVVAATLTNLGVVLSRTGLYAEAVRMHERVVGIWISNFGPNDKRVAMPLNNLALVLTEAGNPAAAKAHAQRAVEIQERADGKWYPEVAKRLQTLGIILAELGDYTEARRTFDRAVTILSQSLGPDEPEVAFSLNSIGRVLQAAGDHEGARTYFSRALAIRDARLTPDDPLVAESLNNMGATLFEEKSFDQARTLFERALAINEKIFGPTHSSVAYALNNIAEVWAEGGADAQARPLYERALSVGQQALGPEHPFIATVLTNVAALDQRSGDDSAARGRLTRALGIRERALGGSHPDLAVVLVKLAEVEAHAGRPDAALTAALRGEAVARDHVQLTARALSEREALLYASRRKSGLDVILSLAAVSRPGVPDIGPRAWDAVIRSRALVLDEMAHRFIAVQGTGDAELARLNAELTSLRQRLARLTVRGSDENDPQRYRQLLEQAQRDRDQAERKVAERSLVFRTWQSEGAAGLERVAAGVPADAALVGFVRYQQQGATPVPAYLAFVLSGGASQPQVVPLGPALDIDNLIVQLRKQLAQEGRAPGRSSLTETEYRRIAEGLRRRVWDPLASHLGSARRVFIVPDGALHLLNFAALPVDGSRYLVEAGLAIHYLSAERDVLKASGRDSTAGPLLMVAAPAFQDAAALAQRQSAVVLRGPQPACNDFQSMQFEALPASVREADSIAKLWRGTGKTSDDAVVQLLDTRASEALVKTRASGRRVMHFATHAFFLNALCDAASQRQNPLQLSGLALAGANQRASAPPEGDDGILTAEEIAGLNLSGTDWVVLSGCDTGVGDIRVGEGVLGLRRAFQLAGARTVIMSLWSVEDTAAQAWMVHLYRERLVSHRATDEAVRAASLAVLRERRAKSQSTHPFFWAAFVAAGDWR